MLDISALELPYVEMDHPDFGADPAKHFAPVREAHPWLATCRFGYVVHDYQAIRDLFRMEDRLQIPQGRVIEVMGAEGTPWGRFQAENIFALSGPAHKRIRDLVAFAFTPKQANLTRPLMRKVIAELLDEWAPKGTFDFEEFAAQFPIAVVCSLVGAPISAIPQVKSSLEAIGLSHSFDRSLLPSMQAAMETMDNFVTELVTERRRSPRSGRATDLLDSLLQVHDEGRLTFRELIDLFITLLAGGYDTSKNLLTLIMNYMIDRPEDYKRCADDFDFCRKITSETLRYRSVSTAMRQTTEDIIYREVLLPAGTMLFFALPISLRDPRIVSDPDRFDAERNPQPRHIAFGLGAHMCIGQFIARAQVEEGLHLIAQRLTNPRSNGPEGWRPFFGASGIRGLPIEFDPAPPIPESSIPKPEYHNNGQ